jgi:formylmethanofuran dehydrogenase subunit D
MEKIEIVKAKLSVDPDFLEEYDFDGCDYILLSQDLMEKLGVEEDDYVLVKKNGFVRMRVIPHVGSGVIVMPTWAREKIGAKLNEEVEVIKK